MEKQKLIEKYASKFGERDMPYSWRCELVEQLLKEWEGIRLIEDSNCTIPDVMRSANHCNECNKELENGTVFCNADCRRHYYSD